MADQLLTTAEVAEVLRVHPKHVYRLLGKGLPARRVGSEWRFSRDDVLAWSGGKAAEGDEAMATPAPSDAVAASDPAPALVGAPGASAPASPSTRSRPRRTASS